MRIISGIARGRKLCPPGNCNDIRPTAERAREALFSIIGDKVLSATVLDLYAGTGALGLEAYSRGAKQIVFIEKCPKALKIIEQNCTLCSSDGETSNTNVFTAIKYDLRRGLAFKHPEIDKTMSFDLIFLDPPYNKGLAEKSLQFLNDSHLVSPSTLIIAEEQSKQKLPHSFANISLCDKRQYGETGFWLYNRTTS